MNSLSARPRANVSRYRMQIPSGSMHRCGIVFVIAVTFASIVAANGTPEEQRFQLADSGTLRLDQSVEKSRDLQLKAYMSPSDFARPPSSSVQKGDRFVLSATLAASSLVCYNDTIFRDSFDGTGL